MASEQQAPKMHRNKGYAVPVALALGLAGLGGGYYLDELQHPAPAVYFSPAGGCTDAVVKAVKDAKQQIHVQAYAFNSSQIADALIDAHNNKHVVVQVLIDERQLKNDALNQADKLLQAGIAVHVDGKEKSAHDKVMVIDGIEVVTGSFNFTKAAEEDNAENLIVLTDGAVARKYDSKSLFHKGVSAIE